MFPNLGYDSHMPLRRPRPAHMLCEIETRLSDGRAVCLRTIRPSDEARIRNGIAAMSDRSRYLRFFSAFRTAPESIVKRLSAVDGHDHIGWGAILLDGAEYPPIGAAHVIRSDDISEHGELAIAVLDQYQGFGLAPMLIAAVLLDCLDEGIVRLDMQMLAENRAASKLVTHMGAVRQPALDAIAHYQLDVANALEILSNNNVYNAIISVLTARINNS